MSKYDWQMNEILQMVNEEKIVRGHLRSLASKLIEEVDSLRSQTAAATSTSANMLPITSATSANSTNGPNAWKNRCSEKRDRINAQNMQIALEKELAAKQQLNDEINVLKSEVDARAHKISDLQTSIDQLNASLVKSQQETSELKAELVEYQKTAANNANMSTNAISASSTSSSNPRMANLTKKYSNHSFEHLSGVTESNLPVQLPIRHASVSSQSSAVSASQQQQNGHHNQAWVCHFFILVFEFQLP